MTAEEQAKASPEGKDESASPDQQSAADKDSSSNTEVSIRLDQFLQGCGVATGGQAKRIIQAGEVLVNEQVETRRKKKLVVGDEVTLDDEVYVVALDDGSNPEVHE